MDQGDIDYVQNAIVRTQSHIAWKAFDEDAKVPLLALLSKASDALVKGALDHAVDALEDFLLGILRITGERSSSNTTLAVTKGLFPEAFSVAAGPGRTYEIAGLPNLATPLIVSKEVAPENHNFTEC